MNLVDITDLICPGCGDPVIAEKPDDGEGEFRHLDGDALCYGLEPIEVTL